MLELATCQLLPSRSSVLPFLPDLWHPPWPVRLACRENTQARGKEATKKDQLEGHKELSIEPLALVHPLCYLLPQHLSLHCPSNVSPG